MRYALTIEQIYFFAKPYFRIASQIEALDESGVDLAAQGSQHGIDGLQGAKHHAVPHAHQAPAPHGLDHLRIEQVRQWHPARLGAWPCGLAAWRLHPVPKMRQQRRGVLLEAVGQE